MLRIFFECNTTAWGCCIILGVRAPGKPQQQQQHEQQQWEICQKLC